MVFGCANGYIPGRVEFEAACLARPAGLPSRGTYLVIRPSAPGHGRRMKFSLTHQ